MIIAYVEGCYENKLYTGNAKSDSHIVKITWDENAEKFTWKNKAGVEWSLYPVKTIEEHDQWSVEEHDQWNTTMLEVGVDCWYNNNTGYKEAKLEYEGNTINIIRGPGNEPYTRDDNACPESV